MFNTAQQQYVTDLVNTLYSEYPYYIAFTHTSLYSFSQRVEPDLYLIFSKDKIEALSGYQYSLSGECKQFKVRTLNYSTSNNSVNTDRVEVDDYTQEIITIDSYEHIYTNAEFKTIISQPDILKEGSYQNVKIDTNSVLLAVFLLVFCFFKMWQIHR